MLIYIVILIVLVLGLYSNEDNNKNQNDQIGEEIIHSKTSIENQKNEKKLVVETENFLKNFNNNDDMIYFKLFLHLKKLEENTFDETNNFFVLGSNSYQLPKILIDLLNKYNYKFDNNEILDYKIELEIKKIIFKLKENIKVNKFLSIIQYISQLYFHKDELIILNVCDVTYNISKKFNLILIYIKNDIELQKLFLRIKNQMNDCKVIL